MFSGLQAGLVPRKLKTKGQPPRTQRRLRPRGPGFHTKRGPGGAQPSRAGAPGTADPQDCESHAPALNPNKHENGSGRPASRPFVPVSPGAAAAGLPPLFCVPSPTPPAAFPTSAAGKAGSLPGLSPRALERTKRGSAPNLGEGED